MLNLALASWVLAAFTGGASSSVKFEKDGLRVGEAVLPGAVLELKKIGEGTILASANVVEPLSAEVRVELADGRALVMEPGVRVTREKDGFRLSTHAGRALKVHGASFKVEAPALVRLTEKGWDFGSGNVLAAAEVRVGLQGQSSQDPDDSLETMRRAARRVEKEQTSMSQRVTPPGTVRVQRIDPTAGSEATESQTLRAQAHQTPVGF